MAISIAKLYVELTIKVNPYLDASIKVINSMVRRKEGGSSRRFTFRKGTAIYRFDYTSTFKFESKRERRIIGRNIRKILRNPDTVPLLKCDHQIAEAARRKITGSYGPPRAKEPGDKPITTSVISRGEPASTTLLQ